MHLVRMCLRFLAVSITLQTKPFLHVKALFLSAHTNQADHSKSQKLHTYMYIITWFSVLTIARINTCTYRFFLMILVASRVISTGADGIWLLLAFSSSSPCKTIQNIQS